MNVGSGAIREFGALEQETGKTRHELIAEGWIRLPNDEESIELARNMNRKQRRYYARLIEKKHDPFESIRKAAKA